MSRNSKLYHYYVEGECEKKFLRMLKEHGLIPSGKIQVFNVATQRITKSRLMPLKNGTIVILVFDTDVSVNIDILNNNIQMLKCSPNVKEVVCIPQVNNFEDELMRSCNIKDIRELTGSRSHTDFKRDMLKMSNLEKKLEEKNFNFAKLWNTNAENNYKCIVNQADKIKKV